MDAKKRRQAAKQFAQNWKGRGYEKGDAQTFWNELLRDVVGFDSISSRVKFEYRTASGGFIDALIPDSKVIIEQKAIGVDLDKPEVRQGREVTPFEQALAYAESFPQSEQPRFIVVCNFETFRVHDRNSANREELPSRYLEFTLEELGDKPSYLGFIADPENSRIEKQKQVSMLAGAQINKLLEALRGQYIDPDSADSQHSLNVLCVRLVFCLFCEDAELFQKDALLNYLKPIPAQDIRRALRDLFEALNTPIDQRDPYERDKFAGFPYVNGGLFAEDVEIPNFTDEIKFMLLFEASQQVDWSDISPTIFGGIFESTLNPETRRSGGMHYTSPENIHKVIDPLFLDALHAEFDGIRMNGALVGKGRRQELWEFRRKMASLRFLDPACGSGNFLTETYLSLCELENDVLSEINDGQTVMVLGDDGEVESDVRVSLSQFYGIEINDFAVRVAKTALWIAQLQANGKLEMLLDVSIEDFPLKDSPNIVHGNALRTDWNEVLSADECDYVIGNPPFVGYSNQSRSQKEEMLGIWRGADGKPLKMAGKLDYVSAWYRLASEYMHDSPCVKAAFVSTNSICQGDQVAPIWGTLSELFDIRIEFAWPTFAWNSEASDQAHVHVVIVGFCVGDALSSCRIFGENGVKLAQSINGYLADAPTVFVESSRQPLSDVPLMSTGNRPADGGNLIIEDSDKAEFIKADPKSEKYIRPFLGSKEFINNKTRWCLWLVDMNPVEMLEMPMVKARVEACRDDRLSSSDAGRRKLSETPTLFREQNSPPNRILWFRRSHRRGAVTFQSGTCLRIPFAATCSSSFQTEDCTSLGCLPVELTMRGCERLLGAWGAVIAIRKAWSITRFPGLMLRMGKESKSSMPLNAFWTRGASIQENP